MAVFVLLRYGLEYFVHFCPMVSYADHHFTLNEGSQDSSVISGRLSNQNFSITPETVTLLLVDMFHHLNMGVLKGLAL